MRVAALSWPKANIHPLEKWPLSAVIAELLLLRLAPLNASYNAKKGHKMG